MWDVSGMLVSGIRGWRLVYKKVVGALSNYKKSYFWWYGNLVCGDSTGSTRLKKIRLVYPPDLFEGTEEKVQCDLVCVERFWMIGLMMVMLMFYSRVVNVVLVLSGAGLVLRRRYGWVIKNILSLFKVSEVSVRWHFSSLILAID